MLFGKTAVGKKMLFQMKNIKPYSKIIYLKKKIN